MAFRFEQSGLLTGAENMHRDEALARSLAQGEGEPTVRVYGWNPPAVSVGWNQSVDDLDTGLVKRAGWDLVRRPTGGRAILHDQEVTYAVAMRSQGQSVMEVYERISRALVEALGMLGVRADLERTVPDFRSQYTTSSGMACFSSAGRYEVKVDGRKLVGSAQRRFGIDGEVALQHGSILLGPGHLRIAEVFRVGSPEERQRIARDLETSTTDLAAILRRPVMFNEVADAIRSGFERAWGIAFMEIDEQVPISSNA